MADNVPITPGSGVTIATDDVSGVMFQKFKLDVGSDGASKPAFSGGSDGLPVELLSSPTSGIYVRPAAGQTFPVSIAATVAVSASASLPVSAVVGSPVFVRLSDGSSAIATLPVSGTVAVTQSTAAAASGAWPTKISDGTDVVGISSVSTARALKVDVIQTVGTVLPADEATFTAATTKVSPIAGVYDDSVGDPSSGQLAGIRVTLKRGLHVNLRAAAGTEIGSSGAPIRVDPTDTTKQSIKTFDASGNAFSDANPLPTSHAYAARTRVTKSVSLSASQTAAAVWTPASGKKFYITRMELLVSVTGALTLFDQTNAAANLVVDGVTGAWTVGRHSFDFSAQPWPSATADNILKYTSGTGLTAVITVHGFEI